MKNFSLHCWTFASPRSGSYSWPNPYRIYYVEARSEPEWILLLEQLIAEIGGRPVSQIIDDQPDPPFLETQIPVAYRGHLSQLYREMDDSLTPVETDRLYLFLNDSFPSYHGRHGAREYFENKLSLPAPTWDGIPPGMPTEPDITPPQVLSQLPADGSTASPQTTVEAVLTDGSFWNAQIHPESVRVFVDGQDVTHQLIRHTQYNTTDRDADWERLRVVYKPQVPLSPGTHTAHVTATDLGKNVARSQWSFTVTSQPLTVDLQVLSKHVKPRKNEVARVAVQCSRYPVDLQFLVKRGSVVVYSASVAGQTGTYEFVWNGTTSTGQPAPNGNHSIEVEAGDGAGGRAADSANVQVNNNS